MKKRDIIVEGDIARIPLTQGFSAVIDAADLNLVDGRAWYAQPMRNTVYAVCNAKVGNGKMRLLRIHRVILGIHDPAVYVDHEDGNGLNNRRSNIRSCSQTENARNSITPITNSSGYKGVCWHAKHGRWMAQIRANGAKLHLGYFDTREAAYVAYCAAAADLHGEFARVA